MPDETSRMTATDMADTIDRRTYEFPSINWVMIDKDEYAEVAAMLRHLDEYGKAWRARAERAEARADAAEADALRRSPS